MRKHHVRERFGDHSLKQHPVKLEEFVGMGRIFLEAETKL
jgi:hypothetical protein